MTVVKMRRPARSPSTMPYIAARSPSRRSNALAVARGRAHQRAGVGRDEDARAQPATASASPRCSPRRRRGDAATACRPTPGSPCPAGLSRREPIRSDSVPQSGAAIAMTSGCAVRIRPASRRVEPAALDQIERQQEHDAVQADVVSTALAVGREKSRRRTGSGRAWARAAQSMKRTPEHGRDRQQPQDRRREPAPTRAPRCTASSSEISPP